MKNTAPDAYAYFEEAQFSEQLDQIYSEIPEGSCKGCTQCCSESVNTFFSEYLNLRNQLAVQGELEAFERASVYYYLSELVQPMKCPLLRPDGRCAVYNARPLPCRIFGHLRQEDYEANYEAVAEGNRAMASQLATQLQIQVPQSVVDKKIEFCRDFVSEKPMSADDRDALVDELFYLDSLMLSRGLLDFDDVNLSLVQWFAYDALGRDNAQQLRIKVSQEISIDGNSKTLLQTMENL